MKRLSIEMFEYISGKIVLKKPQFVILEQGNIGYKIFIPLSTYYKLPDVGEGVKIFVEEFIKEDRPVLYGFLTEEEREIFLDAIKVPGIGTKTAISLLSGMEMEKLIENIVGKNIKEISKIPGIGKKTAERLCLELREKFSKRVSKEVHSTDEDMVNDLFLALINLGYSKKAVEKVVKKVFSSKSNATLEGLIRESLRYLSKF